MADMYVEYYGLNAVKTFFRALLAARQTKNRV